MSTSHPVAEQLPANVEHGAPTPWLEACQRLDAGRWYWLATEHPAGRPHVRPVLAVWLEDALYFVAGAASRKARNIAQNAKCAVTVATDDAHLVVEGRVAVVRDALELGPIADAYATKYEWRVRVQNGAFAADYGAPTAGPPPYDVYRLTPDLVYGFGTEESWAPTRWRF
jgi:nitroimidazol reductase NimA-like FMN-containing flavoprotein (pyridoxamine 5'-phosphate oxidase superfamily)